MYDYKRPSLQRRAADARHVTYAEALEKLRMTFVGEVGEGVYDYITMLHKRIGSAAPWSDITGFKSWDYGSPHNKGEYYTIRVWQKDSATYPSDIVPVVDVNIDFSVGVGVVADARQNRLVSKRLNRDTSPSEVALMIGAGWEKLLTGSVDYGD